MNRRVIVFFEGTPAERREEIPVMDDDFVQAAAAIPARAAVLWTRLMENSVCAASLVYSWRDPARADDLHWSREKTPPELTKGTEELADEIERAARAVIDDPVLDAGEAAHSLSLLQNLSARTESHIRETSERRSLFWSFVQEKIVPTTDMARLNDVPLPSVRDHLRAIFSSMSRIVEEMEITIDQPRQGDLRDVMAAEARRRFYGDSLRVVKNYP